MATQLERYPKVSVVVPMRNEELHIAECLASLFGQDYPREHLEILVLDGNSIDKSAQLVDAIAATHVHVRRIENSGLTSPAAMNAGAGVAQGEILIRLDTHARAPSNYVSTIVRHLMASDAAHVGVCMEAVGRGFWGRCIAVAVTSRFGVGGSAFRCSARSGWDEAGWLGGFWRERLRELGGFNEAMVANEDDELAFRLTKLGARQFRTTDVRLQYYCRERLSALWQQYFRYGKGKPKVILLHRHARLRHFVPAAATLLGLLLMTAAVFSDWARTALLLASGAYLLLSMVFSYLERKRLAGLAFLALPIVYVILHASYGIGFLSGAIRELRQWVRAH